MSLCVPLVTLHPLPPSSSLPPLFLLYRGASDSHENRESNHSIRLRIVTIVSIVSIREEFILFIYFFFFHQRRNEERYNLTGLLNPFPRGDNESVDPSPVVPTAISPRHEIK